MDVVVASDEGARTFGAALVDSRLYYVFHGSTSLHCVLLGEAVETKIPVESCGSLKFGGARCVCQDTVWNSMVHKELERFAGAWERLIASVNDTSRIKCNHWNSSGDFGFHFHVYLFVVKFNVI